MYNYKKYVICVAVALVMGVGTALAYAENNKGEKSHEIIADSSSNVESSSSLNESSLNESSLNKSSESSKDENSKSSKIESESKSESSSNVESSEIEDSSSVEFLPTNEVISNEPIVVTTPIITETIPPELGEAVEDTTPVLVEETPREVATVADYAPSDLYNQGRLYWGDYQYTWYSERVLPGYGLEIEGRYTDADGFVCDGDGYICVAASSLSKGTVVDTPFGRQGKVYDTGCDWGVVDVYVNW